MTEMCQKMTWEEVSLMVLAEVKETAESKPEFKLFSCGLSEFKKLAEKRFKSVERAVQFDSDFVIETLRNAIGWEEKE